MRERWFPLQHTLPDGSTLGRVMHAGPDWQIFRLRGDGRMLVARSALADRWISLRLIPDTVQQSFVFAEKPYRAIASRADQRLEPVGDGEPPDSKSDALAFALSLSETRKLDARTPLHDSIYVERFSRLLPTWTISECLGDEEVLGRWLTGGVSIPATSLRRLAALLVWFDESDVRELVEVAGIGRSEPIPPHQARGAADVLASAASPEYKPAANQRLQDAPSTARPERRFRLPGRRALEAFFSEHVIDIVENPEQYESLGIKFPASMVLYGPPGCGKSFALARLTEYLDWPIFPINSNSVGSPYIHETARRVSAFFDAAISAAPSILVIEEMESYLSDRTPHQSNGLHHVEEVGEFLRRMPEAQDRRVLVIGTTNRLEMIDPAILRRGRFDHMVEVGVPSADEVSELLETLLQRVPRHDEFDTGEVVKALTGRALSDTAFVVREGARLAGRAGKEALDAESLQAAVAALPSLDLDKRPIGFRHD